MSPARSPPGTLCFDIFPVPPGDSDVTTQRDRLSSSETKIAPGSVRIAAGVMIAGQGVFMAVSRAGGCLGNPALPERRSRSTAHGILNRMEMTMTDERMALLELAEKQADGDPVREMPAFAADRIMELEAELRTGAARGARSPLREVRRNGCRERDWDTRAGRIAPEIPKLRRGSHLPSLPEPRRPAGKALVAVIQEAYVQGISTRSVDDPVKAMG